MIIELAKPHDIHDLLVLLKKQFAEHRIEFDPDQLKSSLMHLIAHEDLGCAWIAREGRSSIGFAIVSMAWTLELGGKSAWLDELYVLPQWRNAGVGTLLIESVIEKLRKLGCLAIDLEVDDDHRRAESLYARFGFESLERSRWVKRLIDF